MKRINAATALSRSTGEHLTRMTWAPNRITIYSNYGVWAVYDGPQAAKLNAAFLHALEQSEKPSEMEGSNEQRTTEHQATT